MAEGQSGVLLIESDQALADMLRRFFERDGYLFFHALTGTEGLERLRLQAVSAILLDLNLSDVSGAQTCRRIRRFDKSPLIILTTRDAELDNVLSLSMGADDLITKPFSPRELLARVKAVMRRSGKPHEPKVVEISGFEIDSRTRSVIAPGGETVEPSAKGFDLLWFLAENSGIAISRNSILESVWGYESLVDTTIVDAHVRQLQEAIRGIPIETVWGVGYRLRV